MIAAEKITHAEDMSGLTLAEARADVAPPVKGVSGAGGGPPGK
jgi:hypothetical protein